MTKKAEVKSEVKRSGILRVIFSSPLLWAFVFFAVNLVFVLFHEQWADEAIPWQIAKYSDFGNFYENMSVEPHPPLWYLILMPFAKLGLPLITLNIISLVLVTLAVYLMYKYAPFGVISKILISFSVIFFYYNPVIARSYSLIPLAIACVGITYKNRLKHPIKYALSLALLSQTHFLCGVTVAVMAIWFSFEYLFNKQDGRGRRVLLVPFFAILVASLASMIPMIIGSFSQHKVIHDSMSPENFNWPMVVAQINMLITGTEQPILEVVILLVTLSLLFSHIKLFVLYITSMIYIFFVFFVVYQAALVSPQRLSMVTAIAFLIFWIGHYEVSHSSSKKCKGLAKSEIYKLLKYYLSGGALCLLPIIITIPSTVAFSLRDINEKFSYSHELSNYIDNLEDNAVYLFEKESIGMLDGLIAYDNEKHVFYDISEQHQHKIYQYDIEKYTGFPSQEEFTESLNLAIDSFSDDTPLYLLSLYIICSDGSYYDLDENQWEKVEVFRADIDMGDYNPIVLYKLKR